MRNQLTRLLLVAAFACVLTSVTVGCAASTTIVELPPPEGLPDLQKLEKHLDYKDPDDGRPNYVPKRSE